jgi:RNA polymerase sigma factor (sigma-70 family)
MPNFDGTIDNRWRPDFESSQRRVREEEADAATPVIQSRELSFVPASRKRTFEPHDAQTRALIRRAEALAGLRHGPEVQELLEEWSLADRMKGPEEKQRLLEPRIHAVQRDPVANEHLLVFLMVVFEPVRRSVSKQFVNLHSGLQPAVRDVAWSNRSEARMLAHIERESLFDVTREAALEAVYRYPSDPPDKFFPWLRETIAYRALDKLRADLPEPETTRVNAAEMQALQDALCGFDELTPPRAAERSAMRAWRSRIAMRDVFDVVETFYDNDAVRDVCTAAIGRLPRREQEVITKHYFRDMAVADIAASTGVSEKTTYNQRSSAHRRLRHDDVFFSGLAALDRVRDRARMEAIAARYPDGVRPDGRRVVAIDAAA